MTASANSVLAFRRRSLVYWITTSLLVFELVLGGFWDVLRVPQVREVISRLGYPTYFLIILGIWKLLGAVALAVPRFPRLKEWAYAGVFFNLTGAVVPSGLRGDKLQFEPGDRIVLFTDGASEACNVGGDEFGEERIARTAAAIATGSAQHSSGPDHRCKPGLPLATC